ncbi:MAG: succinate dehydrogenase/fumarate reductase cytochrome b subunit [Bacteroidales bacterium]|nr:succinate dehydrogenase/fumarate reductase cytochrome b subunit [Bacteroidales bacterium]
MKGFFFSSIGKKVIMSVSGLFLILFLLFHMCMNLVVVFSDEAYNKVCEFLGTNWYALIGTGILALGFVVHIVYATILTIQNRKARGNDRYDNQNLPAGVEWSSKNMFVLGAIVFIGLLLHFCHFWSKMMYAELAGCEGTTLCNGTVVTPTDGAALIHYYFSQPLIVVLYLVWFVAIWFHLNHGFWSALHTLGANNSIWIPRLKAISTVFTTCVMGGFALTVLIEFFKSL